MNNDSDCGNCRFFVPYVPGNEAGNCHRHAPVVMDRTYTHPTYGLQNETATAWPDTVRTNFCGDWETKP